MEPLFQLNFENIDILLVNMKERLMLHDKHSQVHLFYSKFVYDYFRRFAPLYEIETFSWKLYITESFRFFENMYFFN